MNHIFILPEFKASEQSNKATVFTEVEPSGAIPDGGSLSSSYLHRCQAASGQEVFQLADVGASRRRFGRQRLHGTLGATSGPPGFRPRAKPSAASNAKKNRRNENRNVSSLPGDESKNFENFNFCLKNVKDHVGA